MNRPDRIELTPDQRALQRFLETPAGSQLKKVIALEQDSFARVRAERAERGARESEENTIKATLSAESSAFGAAGLVSFNSSDAMGHTPMRYYQQPVVLLNSGAHPAALLATALSRAERAQAFARVFSQSEVLGADRDAADGAYTLARMIEEVVGVLQVALEHQGVRGAPVSALSAT